MIRKKFIAVLLCFISLLFLAYILFFNTLLTRATQHTLSYIFNSPVELNRASIQWSPFALVLENVSVVDANHTSMYLFTSPYIKLALSPTYLLKKQIICNELVIDTIQTNTPRLIPYHADLKQSKSPSLTSNSISTPSVSKQKSPSKKTKSDSQSLSVDIASLVKNSDLTIHKKTAEFEKSLTTDYEKLKKELSLKDTNDQINAIETRIETLIDSQDSLSLETLSTIPKEWKRIQSDLKTINVSLSQKKSLVSNFISTHSSNINTLPSIATQDFEALKNTLDVSQYAAGTLKDTLIPDTIENNLNTYIGYITLVKRILSQLRTMETRPTEQGKGTPFHFHANETKLPMLWIKSVDVRMKSSLITLSHISSNQSLINKPTRLYYKDPKKTIHGKLDYRNSTLIQTYQLQQTPQKIAGFNILHSGSDHLTLDSAMNSIFARMRIESTDLSGTISLRTDSINISTPNTISSRSLIGIVSKVVNKTKEINTTATLSGSLLSPKLAITSDIDDALKTHTKAIIASEKKALERELNQAIQTQLVSSQTKLHALLNTNIERSNDLISQVETLQSLSESINTQSQPEKDTLDFNKKAVELDHAIQNEVDKLLKSLF